MLEDEIRKALATTSRTLQELADETGIGRVHISQFKAGDKRLGIDNLTALAAALGLKIVVKRAAAVRKKPKN